MIQGSLTIVALSLLALIAPHLGLGQPRPVEALDPARPVASLLPEDALVVVEGPGLSELFGQGTSHPFVANLLATRVGELIQERSGLGVDPWLTVADTLYGAPVLGTLESVTARGAALALRPRGNRTESLLVLHGDDARRTESALRRALRLVEVRFGIPGALERPQSNYLGAGLWSLGDELTVARRDALLVLGNDEDMVRECLRLAADASARGLLASRAFDEANATRPDHETLWAWVDLHALAEVDAEAFGDLRRMARDPGAQALLGPGVCGLGNGRSLSLSATLEAHDLSLRFQALESAVAASLRPSAAGTFRAPAALPDLEDVAQGRLHRNYAGLVAQRAELFAPERMPDFSNMLATLSLFFGGQDVGEEILPDLSPWIRILARPVEFGAERTPEIPLPALVLTAELGDAERTGARCTTAFQTLIGVINADRAQQAKPPLELRLGLEDGVQITSAHALAPMPGDGVDISYNLEPACAVVNDTLVLGTHEHLVRSVVHQLQNGAAQGSTPIDAASDAASEEYLGLSTDALARAMESNLETLIMGKVLDEGMRYADAKRELEGLLLVLDCLESVEARIAYGASDAPGAIRATLDVALATPSTRR